MNIQKLFNLLILSHCLLFIGCSSAPYKAAKSEFDELTLDTNKYEIENVAIFQQTPKQCGATALATLLNYEEEEVSPLSLYDELYVPDKEGSYQLELAALSRTYDLLPYTRSSNIFELITELKQNKPLIVLLNLGLKKYPVWHYAVATGYNSETREIVLHDGKKTKSLMSFKRFEKAWRTADYWALSLHNVDHLPIYADPDIVARELSKFELLGKGDLAFKGYKNGVKLWPNKDMFYVGLANTHFKQGQYSQSIQAYRKAIELSEHKAPILHNLALAYQKTGDLESALNIIFSADDLLQNSHLKKEESKALDKRISVLKEDLQKSLNINTGV